MKVVWSPLALDKIRQQAHYIARDDRRAAGRWIEDVFAAVEPLAGLPRSGRIVPELQDPDTREIIHDGYRIIYRIEAKQISILTVRHSRQRLTSGDLEG